MILDEENCLELGDAHFYWFAARRGIHWKQMKDILVGEKVVSGPLH